jgi:hypothetical protein
MPSSGLQSIWIGLPSTGVLGFTHIVPQDGTGTVRVRTVSQYSRAGLYTYRPARRGLRAQRSQGLQWV